MQELATYLNEFIQKSNTSKWKFMNAHGIVIDNLNTDNEIYHWYEGCMIAREVAKESFERRNRIAKEYFFIGRFSDQEQDAISQRYNIPGNPRVFTDPSPLELVITSGVSWTSRQNEPLITNINTNPYYVLRLSEESDMQLALVQFERVLAEQASRQIPDFPR